MRQRPEAWPGNVGGVGGAAPDEPAADDLPAVTRLLDLAADRASGALHLNGRRAVVHLDRGQVAHVESVLTPGVAALLLRPVCTDERWAELLPVLRGAGPGESEEAAAAAAALLRAGSASPAHVEIVRRGAMADAALVAVGGAVQDAALARSRFRPGERHWLTRDGGPPGGTMPVGALLAEVNRRGAVLARLAPGVRADRPFARTTRLPRARVRLSPAQWDLVRLADGRRTPLDAAWELGRGAVATTVAVDELTRLGLVRPGGPDEPVPPQPASPEAPPPRWPDAPFLDAFLDAAPAYDG